MTAVIFCLLNLVVDVVSYLVDPRVQRGVLEPSDTVRA